MSKQGKNNNNDVFKNGKSIVARVTDNLNKHGEIRGSSKKETKNLKAMCPHHKITKKGKVKPTVQNDGQGTCTCEMCNSKFTTHLANKDEINKIVRKTAEMLSQARFMAESADLGNETKAYLANVSVLLRQFPGVYNDITKVVKKSNDVKKKKKHNGGGDNVSGNLGAWR